MPLPNGAQLYDFMDYIGATWIKCGVWHLRDLVIESEDGVHVTVTRKEV